MTKTCLTGVVGAGRVVVVVGGGVLCVGVVVLVGGGALVTVVTLLVGAVCAGAGEPLDGGAGGIDGNGDEPGVPLTVAASAPPPPANRRARAWASAGSSELDPYAVPMTAEVAMIETAATRVSRPSETRAAAPSRRARGDLTRRPPFAATTRRTASRIGRPARMAPRRSGNGRGRRCARARSSAPPGRAPRRRPGALRPCA